MSADIPNAFIQTRMRDKVKDERIIMKVQGDVIEFLLKLHHKPMQDTLSMRGVRRLFI